MQANAVNPISAYEFCYSLAVSMYLNLLLNFQCYLIIFFSKTFLNLSFILTPYVHLLTYPSFHRFQSSAGTVKTIILILMEYGELHARCFVNDKLQHGLVYRFRYVRWCLYPYQIML